MKLVGPFLATALGWAACTDSELAGQPPARDTDETGDTARPDATEVTLGDTLDDVTTTDVTTTDTGDVTTTDTTTDTSVTDTTDTVGPDAGCTSDEACRDALAPLGECEDAVCDLPTGACKRVDVCVSCAGDAECFAIAPACARARCELTANGQGTCRYERTNACCGGDVVCDDADPCSLDVCDDGYCASTPLSGSAGQACCQTTPVLVTGFSPPPPFQWRSTVADAGWKIIDTSMATSPEAVLYLGNTSTMTAYPASLESYVATATFNLGRTSPGTVLQLRARFFVELRMPGGPDAFQVLLRDAQGKEILVVERGRIGRNTWYPIYREVELDNEGPWVLEFKMDTAIPATEADRKNLGVMVDDLEIQLGCASGCEPGTACPSDDPCVVGRCSQQRECVYEPIPNCGCTPERCDDGDPCTRDFCAADGCGHEAIPGCGGCDGCDDNDPCTLDRCNAQTGECFYEGNPECCTNNEQCRDGNPCTADSCRDDGTCRHELLPIPGCTAACDEQADCDDGQFCSLDSCVNGQCQRQLRDCDDGDPCTFDLCDGQACQHIVNPQCGPCVEQVLWTRAFAENEIGDITIDGSSFSVGWRVDGVKSVSPPRALRYGNADGTSYASPNGGRNFGRATGPFVAVPPSAAGARLTFKTFIDIDDEDPDNDLFRARLLIGDQNIQIWDRAQIGGTTNGVWATVTVDLPPEVAGQSVRLRWTFDTTDGDDNDGQGVFVDDIVLQSICPAP
ncbi:MAG: hypothetical protein IT385_18045 [Deltaproteobacteria bacterium]|nr:hypothetical protein [Deltaproteobacteria bacterium]